MISNAWPCLDNDLLQADVRILYLCFPYVICHHRAS
jgi:hypothetical protein